MKKFSKILQEYEDVAQTAVVPAGYTQPSVSYKNMGYRASGKPRTEKGMNLQLKWLKKRIKRNG